MLEQEISSCVRVKPPAVPPPPLRSRNSDSFQSSFRLPGCYTVEAMKRSIREIAEALQVRLIGDGNLEVSGVASLHSASVNDLVFVEDEKHMAEAMQSRAGAIIAGEFAAPSATDRPLLISDHPKLLFARAAQMLRSGPLLNDSLAPNPHPTAVIHASAVLGSGVHVDARAVLGEGVKV